MARIEMSLSFFYFNEKKRAKNVGFLSAFHIFSRK